MSDSTADEARRHALMMAADELEAEGERERLRLFELHGKDPIWTSAALNNWVTAWGSAAKHLRSLTEGPPPCTCRTYREALKRVADLSDHEDWAGAARKIAREALDG